MSAIEKLDSDWKNWININIERGVLANKLAASLFDRGWVEAAYELLNQTNSPLKIPHIDTSRNHIKLSDKEYNKFMEDKKLNKKYGMYLKEIRRSKDYYLDEKSERLLANTSSISSLPGQVYELFNGFNYFHEYCQ